MAATTIFRAGDTENAAHGALWMKRRRAGTRTARPWRAACVFALLLFCLLLTAGPVQAATTWTVDSTADAAASTGANSGSLRWVIGQAADGDTIQFASSLNGQTITLETPVSVLNDYNFVVPNGETVTIAPGAGVTGRILAFFKGPDFNGNLIVRGGISTTGSSGIWVQGSNVINTFSGTVTDNSGSISNASSSSRYNGGGLSAIIGSITTLSGTVSNNSLTAMGSGSAHVSGGGASILNVGTLSGSVTGNTAGAVSTSSDSNDLAEALGGGAYLDAGLTNFTGTLTGNSATAHSDSGASANAFGGGLYTWAVSTLSGTVTGNKAEASATGGSGTAAALGGGTYISIGDTTINKGTYSGNQAIAVGQNARAQGGGFFLDTSYGQTISLTLDPTAGAITFSGNKVTTKANAGDTGTTTPNAIHFGRYDLTRNSAFNTSLTIKNSVLNTNVVTIADGITVDMNNGKTFTMTSADNTYFNWGGPNIFDAAGGSTVTLGSGTQFYSGFSLDNPKVNGSANIILNLNGGGTYYQVADLSNLTLDSFSFSNTTLNLSNSSVLQPYGTLILGDNTILNIASGSGLNLDTGATLRTSGSSQINGAALVIDAGKTLAVDLGKTLTLGAGSTLAVNNGILSFGVGNGNQSGLIDMTAAAAAPTFTGSNTLDISDAFLGTYTVLKAGSAMAGTAPGTFGTFTVGGNAPGTGVSITPSLANSGKDLQFAVTLNQDSAQKVWGGTTGTWNYTDQKWGAANDQTFVLGDLAIFDGTNAGNPASPMAVTVGGTAIETAGMSITGGSYTFSGGKIVGRTDISQGNITPTGRLDIAGSGNIVFNNAVDFSGGLTAAKGSTANITLADYSGGRIVLGEGNTNSVRYLGQFSGKANIQNLITTDKDGNSPSNVSGGALSIWNKGAGAATIEDGSIIKNNKATITKEGIASVRASGGGISASGDIALMAGLVQGNTAEAFGDADQPGDAFGGGVDAENITLLSGQVKDNVASASYVGTETRSVYVYGGGVHVSSYTGGLGEMSGLISDNRAEAVSSGSVKTFGTGGGLFVNKNLGSLSGTVENNKVLVTNTNDNQSEYSYAYGGGAYVGYSLDAFTGTVRGNLVHVKGKSGGALYATGGGLNVGAFFATAHTIAELAGEVSANQAVGEHTGPLGNNNAMASGGGVRIADKVTVTTYSGAVRDNKAIASSSGNTGQYGAFAQGGGLYAGGLGSLTGEISNNEATATYTGNGFAYALGGGLRVALGGLEVLSTDITNNKADSTASPSGGALALGGGAYIEGFTADGTTITKGTYSGNTARATGVLTIAQGGALFLDAGTANPALLTLDPTEGAITFSGNSVTTRTSDSDTGTTTANSLHFGTSPMDSATGNARLVIQDSDDTGNLITISDGISAGLNNGKSFSMTQSGGEFLWGGTNLFDSAGGDTVSLTGGSMRLANGFTLDRGTVNGGTGLLAFNVTGGNLKSEGAATSLKHTALAVNGGTLTVDMGSTLTLDANSTFALNGGTLSFGVGANDASGKIVSKNTTTAPTFAGSNTLDISDWIPGTYTVLSAETPMASNAAATFTTFTMGGTAIDPATMRLSAVLNNEDYELQVIAALNQDSAAKTWGGTAGTWNYTNTNWLPGSSKFVLGDLAIFDGTGAGGAGLNVTVGAGAGTQVETAGMSITGGSYTFSGGKIVGRTDISQGSMTPTGRLDIAGSGNIVFNNAVDFSGGLTVAGGSSANITLADYTGGRVVLGNTGLSNRYSGTFSGKLNIQNQHVSLSNSSSSVLYGGGFESQTNDLASLSIAAGSVIQNNSVVTTSTTHSAAAFGGGVFEYTGLNFSGTVSGNLARATGSTEALAFSGGIYAGQTNSLSGTVSNNTANAVSSTGLSGAVAGGAYVVVQPSDAILSASVRGNKAEATLTGGTGEAFAAGGGVFMSFSDDHSAIIRAGDYTDNQAIAVGQNARAQGGGIFLATDLSAGSPARLILDPTAGAITFSGNKVVENGVETPNAIHYGRWGLTNNSAGNAYLTIQDTAPTNNLITIADGITTDINNGKMFIMTQSGGNFLWGGPNKFDSAGGDTVSLTGGSMRLMNGFSLDRGAVNGGTGLLAFNVTGGNLKSEGAATSLNNTALSVSGGKLTVDLGSTLTLDANSTFALNGGTLSFGVGAGNTSGLIDMTAVTAAPTFAGSNTLDISDWIHGTYTVLSAGAAMNAGDLDTFTKFTVGGNAINPTFMGISAALANSDKDLQIIAQLSRDNKEVAWGGTSGGAWNYTDQNWLDNGNASPFLPGDAALFDSATDQNVSLGGTSISLSGMKVTGAADHTLSGAALHIDASSAQNLPAIDYANHLIHEGTGTLLLNTGSAANPNVIAGAVIVKDGTLALGDGFTMTNTGTGHNMLVGFGQGGSPALDVRGAATLNNMILELADSELRFTAPNSSLTINVNGSSLLNAGVMDVDLNRDKTLAAITQTGGGILFLDESTLRLRHTGLTSDAGSWLLVDGTYSGQFDAVDIATATLTGTVNYDTANSRILFDGTYTVAGGNFPGYSSLSPNARRAWSGFRDAFYNGRTPFMNALDQAYGSPAAFQADLLNILPHASAEGAVSQGIQALSGHNAAAMAAFGYAFGNDALESARSFAPLAFQAPNTLGFNIGSQNRRDQVRLTGRYADRMASLDGNFGYAHSVYSVLGNWQPATGATRNLVASASPEYALNAGGAASGPNTPFGVRIWGGYLGNFAHQDNKGGYAGYDADQNGFLLGGSFDINPNWTAGAYVGWTTGDTRYNGIKTRIDTDATHVGAFARYRREAGPGTVKVTGDILYSYTDNDSRRTVPTALGNQQMKGSFDQQIWGGGLELAYDWKPSFDENTVITPYLAGRYAHLEQDGFTESGNLGLKVGKTDADSFTTTIGLKAARDFQVSDTVILTPKATVGWLHQWADRDVSTNSSFIGSPVTFMTRSVKQDADAALVGAGLDVLVKTGQSWDLGLKLGYGADIRQNSNDQTVFVGLEVKF